MEQCCTAKDGEQKLGRIFAREDPYSIIRREASIGDKNHFLKMKHFLPAQDNTM
jgi:hypothetical protein